MNTAVNALLMIHQQGLLGCARARGTSKMNEQSKVKKKKKHKPVQKKIHVRTKNDQGAYDFRGKSRYFDD